MNQLPHNYHGRIYGIDGSLVMLDAADGPNNTTSVSGGVLLPQNTGGKFELIIWNDSTSALTIGQSSDLTVTPAVYTAATGTGIDVTKIHKASGTGWDTPGTGVADGLVIAKTGRSKDLTYNPGDIIYRRIIDDEMLSTNNAGTAYNYLQVKLTTTVDLSAATLSAAVRVIY